MLSVLVVFFFTELFASCTIAANQFIVDNSGTCDLQSYGSAAAFTVDVGAVFDTGSVNTLIRGHVTQVITGSDYVVKVLVNIVLSIKDLSFVPLFYNLNTPKNLISITNGGLTLENVKIRNASTNGNPAFVYFAVIFLSEFTSLNITNCEFKSIYNSRPTPTDVDGKLIETYGGVIHGETGVKEAKIEIKTSNFTDTYINAERGYGGAFVITTYGRKSTFEVTSCKFTNCQSGYYAGAFDIYAYYFYPTVVIDLCNFTGCKSGRDAGAIYVTGNPATVSNSKFVNCEAKNDGGGIYFYDDKAVNSYNLLSSTFENCVSLGETARSANGGGLFVESSGIILVDGCTFTRCVANAFHGHGGAIANVYEGIDFISFTVKNSKFVECSVDEVEIAGNTPLLTDDGDGGAISIKVALYNTIVIENCEFRDCKASQNGGALDVESGSLIVKGCKFEGSRAESGNGGSIHTTGVIVSIETTNFVYSSLGSATGKGIEVYSTREIIHYGSGNHFACAGDNDVVYKDVSLKLIVCESKTIKDLDCQPGSAATRSTAPSSSSLFRSLFTAVVAVVLASGLLLL